jgi:hypothetical protein
VFSLEQRNHAFSEIEKKIEKLKVQSYPVYSIEREHQFNEIRKDFVTLKSLCGPVYDVEHINKFNQECS